MNTGADRIPVAVIGAAGRMGAAVCAAVDASDDLELVATVDLGDSLDVITRAGALVAVDFSTPDSVMDHVEWGIAAGVHMVVGTTGFTEERLDRVRGMLTTNPGVGVVIAPNFSIGAVLLMRFAADAARYFESVEIIELHHPDKLDAPSGTARHTAEMIGRARAQSQRPAMPDATRASDTGARGARIGEIPVHSLRLRGLVAHEEVLLGNAGEILTLRHDSLDRGSFMPGVLLAVRSVASHPGLTVGLDSLLDQ